MSDTAAPLRLLLVEDEPTQRLLLARTLSRAGYEVTTAEDGAEALAKVRESAFQIIVTDWDMPRMEGTSLCREVRALALTHYTYIVLLTGHDSQADIVTGLDAGADDYLRKPVDATELVARLNAGRRIVRLEQSLRAANARIELLSVTDGLLGIYNRRYLDAQLHSEAERAQRYGRPLAVIVWDVDHFKKINDTHGHATGDLVLQRLVERASAELRPSDWMARYGGEEFVIVLPETDATGALGTAERIRALLAAAPVSMPSGDIAVTASFGVAATPASSGAEVIARADAALYRCKREGRNKVNAG